MIQLDFKLFLNISHDLDRNYSFSYLCFPIFSFKCLQPTGQLLKLRSKQKT